MPRRLPQRGEREIGVPHRHGRAGGLRLPHLGRHRPGSRRHRRPLHRSRVLHQADGGVGQRIGDVPELIGRPRRAHQSHHQQPPAGTQQVPCLGESLRDLLVVQGGHEGHGVVRRGGPGVLHVLDQGAPVHLCSRHLLQRGGGRGGHARVGVDALQVLAAPAQRGEQVAAPAAAVQPALGAGRQRAQDPGMEVRVVVPGVTGVQPREASAGRPDEGVRCGAEVEPAARVPAADGRLLPGRAVVEVHPLIVPARAGGRRPSATSPRGAPPRRRGARAGPPCPARPAPRR